ncbi:hypothetical protein FISHEDRAFT_33582 [Fistulina hepatica ATCC 64428]|uniref:Uncharacterized protein n=1 Tax=Fistulina hepatica ATCC 64428 TaxID=1128425 RepID=A0A0D7AN00_9AGAR|nr:hypothetical protein FISHEDRAFT_33582 [Fistulina hepatica ATCC 64428]
MRQRTMHIIWVLRCERRILKYICNNDDEEEWQSASEIKARWLVLIDARLELDRVMTSRSKFGRRGIRMETVLSSWSGVLYQGKNLPKDWIVGPRVLVGSSARSCEAALNR